MLCKDLGAIVGGNVQSANGYVQCRDVKVQILGYIEQKLNYYLVVSKVGIVLGSVQQKPFVGWKSRDSLTFYRTEFCVTDVFII